MKQWRQWHKIWLLKICHRWQFLVYQMGSFSPQPDYYFWGNNGIIFCFNTALALSLIQQGRNIMLIVNVPTFPFQYSSWRTQQGGEAWFSEFLDGVVEKTADSDGDKIRFSSHFKTNPPNLYFPKQHMNWNRAILKNSHFSRKKN